RYLILLAGLFCLITAQAQTQIPDVSKVRVEQLSDEQVLRIITEAEKRGLNDEQLIQSLSQRGMAAGEQQKLRNRITTVRQQKLGGTRATDIAPPADNSDRSVNESEILYDTLETEVEQEEASDGRIFGSELFRNNDIRFEPNLNIPTPKN